MTASAIIYTTILMGCMVIAAGGYGGLYAIYKLRPRGAIKGLAVLCYVVAALLAAMIVWLTPLTAGWKALMVVSVLAYAIIPPTAWRFLIKLHETERG